MKIAQAMNLCYFVLGSLEALACASVLVAL